MLENERLGWRFLKTALEVAQCQNFTCRSCKENFRAVAHELRLGVGKGLQEVQGVRLRSFTKGSPRAPHVSSYWRRIRQHSQHRDSVVEICLIFSHCHTNSYIFVDATVVDLPMFSMVVLLCRTPVQSTPLGPTLEAYIIVYNHPCPEIEESDFLPALSLLPLPSKLLQQPLHLPQIPPLTDPHALHHPSPSLRIT